MSSGAAVAALQLAEGEHCLDLCCAPGAKLCMMAEAVGPSGSVTGVDVSLPRLCTCRSSMLEKYRIPNARLFLADSRYFAVPPPRTGHHDDEALPLKQSGKRRRRRKGESAVATALGISGDVGDEVARLLFVSELFEARPAGENAQYDKV